MDVAFYLTSLVAVVATVLVIAGRNPVHALLYLITSLLAVAVLFYLLGAPFAAALEVIIYAGAIAVLFVFAIMLLDLTQMEARERQWLRPRAWVGPAGLSAILLAEMLYLLTRNGEVAQSFAVPAKRVGISLFGPYLLGVELASMLLLAALVGAYHLGRQDDAESGR